MLSITLNLATDYLNIASCVKKEIFKDQKVKIFLIFIYLTLCIQQGQKCKLKIRKKLRNIMYCVLWHKYTLHIFQGVIVEKLTQHNLAGLVNQLYYLASTQQISFELYHV